jgi:chemosensory pili system protein ChpA (sensor histidine kinase/response regulator)
MAARKIRVLLVDDSASVRQTLARLLTEAGDIEICAAVGDPYQAVERIAHEVPDVIILDIEMPRMDGFEFTKTIKGDPKFVNIPIIMITSRTAEKHRSRAAELGVDMYLGKPYQEDELLRHLREMTGIAAPS